MKYLVIFLREGVGGNLGEKKNKSYPFEWIDDTYENNSGRIFCKMIIDYLGPNFMRNIFLYELLKKIDIFFITL
jgi:hypothetical protein